MRQQLVWRIAHPMATALFVLEALALAIWLLACAVFLWRIGRADRRRR